MSLAKGRNSPSKAILDRRAGNEAQFVPGERDVENPLTDCPRLAQIELNFRTDETIGNDCGLDDLLDGIATPCRDIDRQKLALRRRSPQHTIHEIIDIDQVANIFAVAPNQD